MIDGVERPYSDGLYMWSHLMMDEHSLGEEKIKSAFRYKRSVMEISFVYFLIRRTSFRIETVDLVDSHTARRCVGDRGCVSIKLQEDVLLMHHYRYTSSIKFPTSVNIDY